MNKEKNIILFDGECNLCNFWVNYVIKKDQKDNFRFTSLQSEIGKELLDKYQVDSSIDSIVLIESNIAHTKSTAALLILKKLGGFNAVLYSFIIIPAFIRDFFYDIIAKYRYRWFGKTNCEFIPNQNIKHKFLT